MEKKSSFNIKSNQQEEVKDHMDYNRFEHPSISASSFLQSILRLKEQKSVRLQDCRENNIIQTILKLQFIAKSTNYLLQDIQILYETASQTYRIFNQIGNDEDEQAAFSQSDINHLQQFFQITHDSQDGNANFKQLKELQFIVEPALEHQMQDSLKEKLTQIYNQCQQFQQNLGKAFELANLSHQIQKSKASGKANYQADYQPSFSQSHQQDRNHFNSHEFQNNDLINDQSNQRNSSLNLERLQQNLDHKDVSQQQIINQVLRQKSENQLERLLWLEKSNTGNGVAQRHTFKNQYNPTNSEDESDISPKKSQKLVFRQSDLDNKQINDQLEIFDLSEKQQQYIISLIRAGQLNFKDLNQKIVFEKLEERYSKEAPKTSYGDNRTLRSASDISEQEKYIILNEYLKTNFLTETAQKYNIHAYTICCWVNSLKTQAKKIQQAPPSYHQRNRELNVKGRQREIMMNETIYNVDDQNDQDLSVQSGDVVQKRIKGNKDYFDSLSNDGNEFSS